MNAEWLFRIISLSLSRFLFQVQKEKETNKEVLVLRGGRGECVKEWCDTVYWRVWIVLLQFWISLNKTSKDQFQRLCRIVRKLHLIVDGWMKWKIDWSKNATRDCLVQTKQEKDKKNKDKTRHSKSIESLKLYWLNILGR